MQQRVLASKPGKNKMSYSPRCKKGYMYQDIYSDNIASYTVSALKHCRAVATVVASAQLCCTPFLQSFSGSESQHSTPNLHLTLGFQKKNIILFPPVPPTLCCLLGRE